MSFTKKVKTFFVVPTSLFAFRSPDPTRSVSAGLRRQRPVLLSWFLLSCVAGALADAKRRRRRDLAAAERKLRTLEELIGEERAGTAGDRPETRKRLRAVGVGRREDMAAWEDERRALERAEAERRAKLGFWKRYFGSTTAGEESDKFTETSLKTDDLEKLAAEFNSPSSSTTTASPAIALPPAFSSVSTASASTSAATRVADGAVGHKRVEFVPAEQRADWAKRNFV